MSVERKTNPVGIDVFIDDMQVHLDSTISLSDCVFYPRAYKNPKEYNKERNIPEIYTGANEYKEVFMDDSHNLTAFFVVGDERENNETIITADVSLIVQAAKLDRLFPNVPHRADEELNQAFVQALTSFPFETITPDIETGVNSVYKEFLKDQVRLDDMGEFYVVRFNFKATYSNDGCCNNC